MQAISTLTPVSQYQMLQRAKVQDGGALNYFIRNSNPADSIYATITKDGQKIGTVTAGGRVDLFSKHKLEAGRIFLEESSAAEKNAQSLLRQDYNTGFGPEVARIRAEKIAEYFGAEISYDHEAGSVPVSDMRQSYEIDTNRLETLGVEFDDGMQNTFANRSIATETLGALLTYQEFAHLDKEDYANQVQYSAEALPILNSEITGLRDEDFQAVKKAMENGEIVNIGHKERMNLFDFFVREYPNPKAVMKANEGSVEVFTAKARKIVDELNEMDRYGMIEFEVHASNGHVVANLSDQYHRISGDISSHNSRIVKGVFEDFEKIHEWIGENRTTLKDEAKAVKDYAMAKTELENANSQDYMRHTKLTWQDKFDFMSRLWEGVRQYDLKFT